MHATRILEILREALPIETSALTSDQLHILSEAGERGDDLETLGTEHASKMSTQEVVEVLKAAALFVGSLSTLAAAIGPMFRSKSPQEIDSQLPTNKSFERLKPNKREALIKSYQRRS